MYFFFPVRLKSIKTQEARMQTILVKIKGMLRDKQEEVEDKLHRDQFIALLQGVTGFAAAIRGKNPFDFINSALDIASHASQAPCRKSHDFFSQRIYQWLTFGKKYVPLEDSSDLDFSQVEISSVPEIMQVS